MVFRFYYQTCKGAAVQHLGDLDVPLRVTEVREALNRAFPEETNKLGFTTWNSPMEKSGPRK